MAHVPAAAAAAPPPAHQQGYDPERSQISETRLVQVIENELTEDLRDVPGVGARTAAVLVAAGLETPYHLFGKFLLTKAAGSDAQAHCDAFWFYLQGIGCSGGYRSAIVQCMAEKAEILLPGLYLSGAAGGRG